MSAVGLDTSGILYISETFTYSSRCPLFEAFSLPLLENRVIDKGCLALLLFCPVVRAQDRNIKL